MRASEAEHGTFACEDGATCPADSVPVASSLPARPAVFLPVALKLYDAVVVGIIVSCCRKKFDVGAAAASLCVFVLALPAVAARFLGIQGLFNTTKLSRTSRVLIADLYSKFKGRRRRSQRRAAAAPSSASSSDAGTAAVVGTAAAGVAVTHVPGRRRSSRRKEEADEADDAGDAGDGGDGGGD